MNNNGRRSANSKLNKSLNINIKQGPNVGSGLKLRKSSDYNHVTSSIKWESSKNDVPMGLNNDSNFFRIDDMNPILSNKSTWKEDDESIEVANTIKFNQGDMQNQLLSTDQLLL